MRVGTLLAAVVTVASVGAPAARAESPSSACASAWNRGAKTSLRVLIVSHDPRGAFINAHVRVSTDTFTKKRSSSTTSAPGCSIQFILGNGHTLTVWGAWVGQRITNWAGPVPSNRSIPVPNNGNVRSDGTVGFHG